MRQKFDEGDYGEEKQTVENYVKKVDKYILSEIQAIREICLTLFTLSFLS